MSKIRKNQRTTRRTDKIWELQEAMANFSELVDAVIEDGYHTITKNGKSVAVLISKNEFEKLRMRNNTLLDFFRDAPHPEIDLDIDRNKDFGADANY